MKTVEGAMDEWTKRWGANGWHKEEDDLSTELVADYWDQDSEEEIHPPHSLRRAAKNRIIREAIEKNRVIDLDAIYKDGKIFGCDVICNLICDEIQIPQFKLDYYREEDGKHYILDYNFDWKYESFILSYIKFENGIPYKARIQIDFHMLFEVKTGLERIVFKNAAESIIREVEKLIDDDKKDNRNS